MSLFDRIANVLIERAKKTPYDVIPGYMERNWLLPYNGFGIAVRINHLLRSDDDRVFHDHPWPYASLILRGGYTEVRPQFESGMYFGDRSKWYGPGSVIFRPARSWHRLLVPEGQTCTTLFITGPKVQSWGFLVEPRYKVYHRDYRDTQ